jgi:tRNA (guanine-N7-)-methyltransferase
MYKRILVTDNFVNLKTDNQLLYEYTLEVLNERGEEVFVSTADVYSDFPDDKVLNIKTFYEQMFLAEGKTIKYIRFRVSK